MLVMRPGQRLYIPGVQVLTPRPVASANWWDVAGQACVAAYQPKGAASLAASYTNLTGNATYNAAPGVAPTHSSADGWTFNGSTQYLTTGVLPNQSYSMIVRFSDVSNNGYICGQLQDSSTFFALSPQRGTGGIVRYAYATTTSDISPGLTVGVLALAGPNRYRNGSADGSFGAVTFIGSVGIHVGAGYSSGSAFAFSACKIQALAIYSTTLSGADVASLTTAINAL